MTAADEATVEAIENGFITLPENAGGLEITKASAGHQAAFGDIQFTIAGTFKFNVTEQPSGIAGITDDQEAERTVVVKVTDKKNGTLEAAVVEGESENLTFINTYGADIHIIHFVNVYAVYSFFIIYSSSVTSLIASSISSSIFTSPNLPVILSTTSGTISKILVTVS